MTKLRTYIATFILVLLTIGISVFSQLCASDSVLSGQSLATSLAKHTPLQDLPIEPLVLNIATDHMPLQAVKVEDVTVSVTQRLRPIYDLFSFALLLFSFENTSYETKAPYIHVKSLHFSAPIYILFKQLII